jgi:molybdenum cofactor biosynthesis enzyme MoaA
MSHEWKKTTGCIKLSASRFAQILKEAGIQRVNVSLDALDNNIFTKMNGVNVRSEYYKSREQRDRIEMSYIGG